MRVLLARCRVGVGRYVVVDEADRLLDASMAPDLDTIFGAMPPATQRHTLLYSATMTKNLERIEALAGACVASVCCNSIESWHVAW